MSDTFKLRFSGIDRLYGNGSASKLAKKHIAVVGVGGVGSWSAEALARSGVGTISLIDMDEICITNTNRQLHTLESTIAQPKVKAIKTRLHEINPDLHVNAITDFVTKDTIDQLITNDIDFIVDAIDSLDNKCLLICKARELGVGLVTTGGAAGKRNPALLKVNDLGFSERDHLLEKLKKRLRREYGFPKGQTVMGIDSVFSIERTLYPNSNGEITHKICQGTNLKLDCDSGMGTASFLTGSFGFTAASVAVARILYGSSYSFGSD